MNRAKLSVIFFFFGMGLRVIYNSDFLNNKDPPWVSKIPKLKKIHAYAVIACSTCTICFAAFLTGEGVQPVLLCVCVCVVCHHNTDQQAGIGFSRESFMQSVLFLGETGRGASSGAAVCTYIYIYTVHWTVQLFH